MAENPSAGASFAAMGDAKRNAQGVASEVKGAAADMAENVSDALSDTVSSFERAMRKTIETQPYTALLIGIGIGWLLGRSHRPF